MHEPTSGDGHTRRNYQSSIVHFLSSAGLAALNNRKASCARLPSTEQYVPQHQLQTPPTLPPSSHRVVPRGGTPIRSDPEPPFWRNSIGVIFARTPEKQQDWSLGRSSVAGGGEMFRASLFFAFSLGWTRETWVGLGWGGWLAGSSSSRMGAA